MEERFPGIDWYCDKCHAYLNSQPGFNDHRYIWQCSECGYKNSISLANIMVSQDSKITRVAGYLLGILRSAAIYAIIVSILSLFFGSGWKKEYLLYSLICYIFLDIISMMFEWFVVRRHDSKPLWVIRSLFYYIFVDCIRPIAEIIGAVASIFSLFTHKAIGFFLYKLFFGIIYLLILFGSFFILVYTQVIN